MREETLKHLKIIKRDSDKELDKDPFSPTGLTQIVISDCEGPGLPG